MFLLTPVEIVRAVLPEQSERGDGAFLLTTGITAVHTMPDQLVPGAHSRSSPSRIRSSSECGTVVRFLGGSCSSPEKAGT
ncbi:hypothetical protein GCM10027444_28310 [Actinopolyspora lacussalsi]